ncbi:MAG: hypothetical protein GX537_09860 [Actinobacteria bacterium]|nr:hypothetical protein [Actinomycetota bacterium]
MRAHRHQLHRISVLLALLLAITLTSVACGGGGMQTYSNDTYGMSFEYDGMFTETSDTSAQGSAGGNSALSVGFFDKEGTKSGDTYRDGFVLNVYELTQQITSEMMPLVKTEIEKLLPQLTQSFGTDAKAGTLQAVTAKSTEGFKADMTFTMDGTPFKSTMYFLISGDTEYQLTMQAAESRWDELQPKFQHIIDSFTVGEK